MGQPARAPDALMLPWQQPHWWEVVWILVLLAVLMYGPSIWRWLCWHGLGMKCTTGRLLFLSRRWQIVWSSTPRFLNRWWVKDFGGGVQLWRLDVVRLPKTGRDL
jgi:hypothetical protein